MVDAVASISALLEQMVSATVRPNMHGQCCDFFKSDDPTTLDWPWPSWYLRKVDMVGLRERFRYRETDFGIGPPHHICIPFFASQWQIQVLDDALHVAIQPCAFWTWVKWDIKNDEIYLTRCQLFCKYIQCDNTAPIPDQPLSPPYAPIQMKALNTFRW